MNQTLEQLLEHFLIPLRVNIFNEEEFVEDVFEEDKIPVDWLSKEVVNWHFCCENLLDVRI